METPQHNLLLQDYGSDIDLPELTDSDSDDDEPAPRVYKAANNVVDSAAAAAAAADPLPCRLARISPAEPYNYEVSLTNVDSRNFDPTIAPSELKSKLLQLDFIESDPGLFTPQLTDKYPTSSITYADDASWSLTRSPT